MINPDKPVREPWVQPQWGGGGSKPSGGRGQPQWGGGRSKPSGGEWQPQRARGSTPRSGEGVSLPGMESPKR